MMPPDLDDDTEDDVPQRDIERALGRMRLMMGRRIIGRLALATMEQPRLDLSHLDVIEAVRRTEAGREATVGSVAEAMRIDHSRGSRLVAELVQRGLLRRAVSQQDARRTVVELTEAGRDVVRRTHRSKRAFVRSILADWPAEEVARFAELFSRFVDGFEAHARLKDPRGE